MEEMTLQVTGIAWPQRRSRILVRGAFTAAMLLLCVLPSYARHEDKPNWVGTWAIPMLNDDSGGKAFQKVTLRQVVRTSVGGNAVRVTFSNLFGTEPLVLEHVRIAVHGKGASIVPSTQQEVHFQGQDSVTIPAGETATSDAAPLSFPALTELAVSLYLPEAAHAHTFHPDAHRSNYIAQGDMTSSTDLTGTASTHSIYFLTGIDADNPKSPGAVVALGASITEGSSTTANSDHPWPAVLATRLAKAHKNVGVLNMGISGNRLLVDGSGVSAEKRFDRDVLQQTGVRAVIFSDEPINDLGSTRPTPSAEALIAGMQRLEALAHQHGILFFCSTLTPVEGAGYWTPEKEVQRGKILAFLQSAGSGCDGIVDQDKASHDPEHPTRYLPAYDHGDHLHPNDAGHEAIGNGVDLSLFDTRKLSGTAGAKLR